MILRDFCVLCLLFLTAAANVCAAESDWMKVLLQGQQIGHIEHSRRVVGNTVITSERFEASLARAGTSMKIITEETHRESIDGKPLGFSTLTDLGSMAQLSEGAIASDGKLSLIRSQGGTVRTEEARYPNGALLSEGARLLEARSALKPGEEIRFQTFVASQMEAVDVRVKYIGEETVDVDGKAHTARHTEQTLALPGSPLVIQSWTDPNGRLLRSLTPMFGLQLEMLATDASAAQHRDPATDLLALTVVASPRALSTAELGGDLRYQLQLGEQGIAQSLPTGEQSLSSIEGGWQLLIDAPPYGAAGKTAASEPVASNRSASNWVQSDAAEIISFAKKATAKSKDARARMMALQTAVAKHINSKNLRVGYASALEALRMREGDCTEHALLLAAAGRAVGVPTRVAVGLAYIDQFATHKQVFVPHAWVQAWVDDRWTSYDAALGGFDSGHIALATGEGDPATFFGSINLLGNIRIQAIEAVVH